MVKAKNSNEQLTLDFIQAYAELDLEKIESFIDKNITAYITNEHAELDKVVGRKAFMDRHHQMKTDGVKLKLTVPQIITISTGQVMVMISIEAERGDTKIHNHAAYLGAAIDGKITELWMVDALPKYSDQFWKK